MIQSSFVFLSKIPNRSAAARAAALITTRRFLSTTAGGAGGPRGHRISGLRRFYQHVNIQSLDKAPWEEADGDPKSSSLEGVDSPISAGVDGTQSASGVAHPTDASKANFRENVIPRFPGVTEQALDPKDITWYGITVDGRFVKTPMGETLAVPSALLAAQIAAEWDAVVDRPHTDLQFCVEWVGGQRDSGC